MAETTIERDFKVTPEHLYQVISTPEGLLSWWGHEGMTLADYQLDFTRLGPWQSTLVNRDGERFKMSGQVTSVNPLESIGLTWAWHDPTDQRGDETHVTFTVSGTDTGGARLTINHRGFAEAELATRHSNGWQSVLNQLDKALSNPPT